MKKVDITMRRDGPALNVKWYPWLPDMFRKFEGVQERSKNICNVCGQPGRRGTAHRERTGHSFTPGGLYYAHEYGDITDPEVAGFWKWVHACYDYNTCEDELNAADEMARESGWELATEYAEERFGSHVKVWGDGRSGGWLVVAGLGDVELWDAVRVSQWSAFARDIQGLVDDLDYQFIWHLYVNVYENMIGALL